MSRPWKVALGISVRQKRGSDSSTTATGGSSSSAPVSSPLSGPTKREPAPGLDGHGSSRRSDAGIDDREVDGTGWKEGRGGEQTEAPEGDVLRQAPGG